ncbi:MAG: 6-carboxytetrahydropterin synthase QueD [Bacteroidia bacterium]|nr:6-carboxytetrahydropterin synthase QueD [Bacteroidia bacterium]
MPVFLTKKFDFEAAHYLPAFPEGHKCRRLHGHSFKVEIKLMGEIDPKTGILVDFAEIKSVVKPYIEMLDHYCLNEVAEVHNIDLLRQPTSENLAKWLFQEIKPLLPQLDSVVVHETCTSMAEYKA